MVLEAAVGGGGPEVVVGGMAVVVWRDTRPVVVGGMAVLKNTTGALFWQIS